MRSWFFFGRYATYLFLECWCYKYAPLYKDDFIPAREADELYTKGAMHVAGSKELDKKRLSEWCAQAKKDSGETAFALETELCGVAKILKGTRYNGYYTERHISYTQSYKADPSFSSLN